MDRRVHEALLQRFFDRKFNVLSAKSQSEYIRLCYYDQPPALVANVTDGSLGNVLGRFKSHTSKKLFELIANNPQESRRDWIIKAFKHAGKYNPLNEDHQFWQNGNYPVSLYSHEVIQQKIDYIHQNPVRAGFVGAAHDYWYSSANVESPLQVLY